MAKRKYGTGSIREKDGTFFIAYRTAPGSDQTWEKVGRLADGTTKKDAEALLEQRRVEIRNGQLPARRQTLVQVADNWSRHRAIENLAPKTREQEKTALDCHLLPAFGLNKLDEITPDDLRKYIAKKRSLAPGEPGAIPVAGDRAKLRTTPLGATAIRQQIQTLNKIFEWALDRRQATSNPCARLRRGDLPTPSQEIEVFEIEEVKRLLAAAKDDEMRTILLLMVGCGLRLGEVFGLKIRDYDSQNQTLHVQRTIRRDWGKTVLSDGPKTSAGDRFLILDNPLAQAMSKQIARVSKEGRNGQGLMFPNRRGNLRSSENFRSRDWRKTLEEAGLPLDRKPHSLRHTFASELIQSGKSDSDIAFKMGHKNAQITRIVYAKTFERVKATPAGVVDLYLEEDTATQHHQ